VDAETYLRNLAESELRRYRGSGPESMLDATGRLRAVAAAFAGTGVLEPDVADAVVDELTTALVIRSPGDPRVRHFARVRHAHRMQPSAAPTAGQVPVSVTPVGALLELRDGESDVNVYLFAAISTPELACVSAGVLSLPKGSLPPRTGQRQGLPSPSPQRLLSGWGLNGVPGDLRAVDAAGRSYDLVFNGGGDGTWSTGQFNLLPNPRRLPPGARQNWTWLDVGNEEHSVRVDLTAGFPAPEVTTTPNGLGTGDQFLRIRAEAAFASGYHDIGTDLPALAAMVPALRAVGVLPDDSASARLIAALCRRYAVTREDVTDAPAALPGRWTDVLTGGQHGSWQEAGGTDPPPAAASMPVTFPETDGVAIVLSGLLTKGQRTTMTGAFFGPIEDGYPEGPCIWLRDDGDQWHVAKPGSWSSGGVNVFKAEVVAPGAADRPCRRHPGHQPHRRHARLRSAHLVDIMNWYDSLPTVDTQVPCGSGSHTVRWEAGQLALPAHPDAEAELVLAALGGDKPACVAVAETWARHTADLRVLATGPRCVADQVSVSREEIEAQRSGLPPGLTSGAVVTRFTATSRPGTPRPAPAPGRQAGVGWGLASSLAPGMAETLRRQQQRLELLELLALGTALQFRLSGMVCAAWAEPDRADERASHRPELAAALTGRFAPAAEEWLGIDPDAVTVTPHEGPGWGAVELTGQGEARRLRAALPVAWLADVWACGLAVVAGYLVVAVSEPGHPRARVLALSAPDTDPVPLEVHATASGPAGLPTWELARP
jgi:hypothetical protein